jgi:hypothetical protein
MENQTEKTKKELLEELNAEKKAAWDEFKQLNYDDLSEEEREFYLNRFYRTMQKTLPPDVIEVPFDFWKDFSHFEQIKDVKTFISHVNSIAEQIPENPTKETWLDRERGIIPNLKREWKQKVEPFKNERILMRTLSEKVKDMTNDPSYKDKNNTIVDGGKSLKKALENIEETLYKPTREKIEEIETEIKKRVSPRE